MDRFYLRPAIQDDETAINRLVRTEHLNPIGLDWRRFVVATTTTSIVIGCGQIKPHGKRGSISRELASLVVKPEWRGQGVARAVIENLLANNDPPIYLTCRASLGPFYERFGFQLASTTKMPPYFRRVNKFVAVLQQLGLTNEGLFVMSYEKDR